MKRKLRNIRSYFRGLTEGISNIIKWMPVIYRDRDYDQEYLYNIIHKKLSSMEEFFRSDHTHIMDALIVADEIREAKDLLGAMINGEHVAKVNFNTDDFINTYGGTFNVDHSNPNYQKWMNEMGDAEQKEFNGMKEAMNIIADKSQGWWD